MIVLVYESDFIIIMKNHCVLWNTIVFRKYKNISDCSDETSKAQGLFIESKLRKKFEKIS